MKKELINLPGINLVGITARTKNINETTPETAQILPIVTKYFSENLASKIENKSTTGTTYCAYTDYESDHTGEYTFFIGEVVESFEGQDLSIFSTLTIPAGNFQKFTTTEGKMPDIVIKAWTEIWEMTEEDFGGARKYHTDFEVYDERAIDPTNTVLDIYIGIE